MELLSVLRRFQKRIVDFENRDEVEITADIQDAVAAILNTKFDLHISREFTMGRALRKLGETDLYIYSEENGIIVDYAILENKYIEKFTEQYLQLMGYLNNNFKFGITLSINRKMSLQKGFEIIETNLNSIEGQFHPIKINKVDQNDEVMIVSQHVVPENNKTMTIYHLIFQLCDTERKEAATISRAKRK